MAIIGMPLAWVIPGSDVGELTPLVVRLKDLSSICVGDMASRWCHSLALTGHPLLYILPHASSRSFNLANLANA